MNKNKPNQHNVKYVPKDRKDPPKELEDPTKYPMVKFVDSHVHIHRIFEMLKLQVGSFKNFKQNEIITVAKQEGVKFGPINAVLDCVINVCCAPEELPMCEELLKEEGIYGSFGIHPHYAKNYTQEIEETLEKWMSHPKTVAWGECGLDYHYNSSPPEIQREVFVKQIQMALKHKKTLVIHSREAENDTLEILGKHLPKDWHVHLHCFTENNPKYAQSLLDSYPNLCIGFTGCSTFKSSKYLRDIIKDIVPLDRLLLETDGPYMAPEGFRGKKAHPGHIVTIASFVAELKNTTLEDVLTKTRNNALRVYRIAE